MTVQTKFKNYIPTWSSPSVLCTKSGTMLLPLAPSAPAGEVIKFEWRNLNFLLSIKNTKHLSQDKIFKYAATFSSPFTPVTVCNYTKETQPFLVCFEISCHPHLNILHRTTFPQGPWCCYYPDRHSHFPNYTYSDLIHPDTEMPLRQCFISEVLRIRTRAHTHKIMSVI